MKPVSLITFQNQEHTSEIFFSLNKSDEINEEDKKGLIKELTRDFPSLQQIKFYLSSNKIISFMGYHPIITTQMIIHFASALKDNTILVALDLSYVNLEYQAVKALAAVLNSTKIKILILRDTYNDDKFISQKNSRVKLIANALKENTSINVLDLNNYGIDDDNIEYLTDAFSANKAVQYLDLGFNDISGIGCRHINIMLEINTTLQWLNLSRSLTNKLSLLSSLGKGLKVNQSLLHLTLGGSHANDLMVVKFFSDLTGNKTLREIVFEPVALTQKGFKAIEEFVRRHTNILQMGFGFYLDSLIPTDSPEFKGSFKYLEKHYQSHQSGQSDTKNTINEINILPKDLVEIIMEYIGESIFKSLFLFYELHQALEILTLFSKNIISIIYDYAAEDSSFRSGEALQDTSYTRSVLGITNKLYYINLLNEFGLYGKHKAPNVLTREEEGELKSTLTDQCRINEEKNQTFILPNSKVDLPKLNKQLNCLLNQEGISAKIVNHQTHIVIEGAPPFIFDYFYPRQESDRSSRFHS